MWLFPAIRGTSPTVSTRLKPGGTRDFEEGANCIFLPLSLTFREGVGKGNKYFPPLVLLMLLLMLLERPASPVGPCLRESPVAGQGVREGSYS